MYLSHSGWTTIHYLFSLVTFKVIWKILDEFFRDGLRMNNLPYASSCRYKGAFCHIWRKKNFKCQNHNKFFLFFHNLWIFPQVFNWKYKTALKFPYLKKQLFSLFYCWHLFSVIDKLKTSFWNKHQLNFIWILCNINILVAQLHVCKPILVG